MHNDDVHGDREIAEIIADMQEETKGAGLDQPSHSFLFLEPIQEEPRRESKN